MSRSPSPKLQTGCLFGIRFFGTPEGLRLHCRPPDCCIGSFVSLLLKQKPDAQMGIRFLARQKGFEPPTFRLGGGCSIQLSYWRMDTSIIMENRVGVKGVGM